MGLGVTSSVTRVGTLCAAGWESPRPECSISDASCRRATTTRTALQARRGGHSALSGEKPRAQGTRALAPGLGVRGHGAPEAPRPSMPRDVATAAAGPSPLVWDSGRAGPCRPERHRAAPSRYRATALRLELVSTLEERCPLGTRRSRTCKPTCQRSAPELRAVCRKQRPSALLSAGVAFHVASPTWATDSQAAPTFSFGAVSTRRTF